MSITLCLYKDCCDLPNIADERNFNRSTGGSNAKRYDIVCTDYKPLFYILYYAQLIQSYIENQDKTQMTIEILSGRKLIQRIMELILHESK